MRILILSLFLAACGGGEPASTACGTSACTQAVIDAQQPPPIPASATIGTPDCKSNPLQCK